jgi:DNA-binding CsgD family transcriptional regulator
METDVRTHPGKSIASSNEADSIWNMSTRWQSMLSSFGRPAFEGEVTRLLVEALGVDQVHIFRGAVDEPEIVASICANGTRRAEQQSELYISQKVWRFDSEFARYDRSIGHGPTVCRFDTGRTVSREMQDFYEFVDVGERVVAIGESSSGRLYLAAIRSRTRGRFGVDEEQRLRLLGEIAFPMLTRHYTLLLERQQLSQALTSLRIIESCLSLSRENFPKREGQVAARILYGLSTEGIGLDLGISADTVVCYRRRFYQRFGIGCFRDLVVWYMELFGRVGHYLEFPESLSEISKYGTSTRKPLL